MNVPFKEQFTFEKRKLESARIIEKYPDRVPVIVQRRNKSDIPRIDKKKFLIPDDLTIGQLMYVLRKRIKIPETKAIFLFCNGSCIPSGEQIGFLYRRCKDEDGFLYLFYTGENVFGI
jgi:GABA(A) receptor-associated protein